MDETPESDPARAGRLRNSSRPKPQSRQPRANLFDSGKLTRGPGESHEVLEGYGDGFHEARKMLSLKRWIKVARRDTAHTVAAALYVLVALGSIPLMVFWTLLPEEGEQFYSSCNPSKARCPNGNFLPGTGYTPPNYGMAFIVGLIITAVLVFIAHLLIKNLVLVESASHSEELARQQERRVSEREAFEESLWKPLPEVVCTHCGLKGQVETHEFPPEDSSDGLTKAILSKFNLFGDSEIEAANKRQRLRSQPNLRCKNCTVAWKDRSLSWKEPNPE